VRAAPAARGGRVAGLQVQAARRAGQSDVQLRGRQGGKDGEGVGEGVERDADRARGGRRDLEARKNVAPQKEGAVQRFGLVLPAQGEAVVGEGEGAELEKGRGER